MIIHDMKKGVVEFDNGFKYTVSSYKHSNSDGDWKFIILQEDRKNRFGFKPAAAILKFDNVAHQSKWLDKFKKVNSIAKLDSKLFNEIMRNSIDLFGVKDLRLNENRNRKNHLFAFLPLRLFK